LALLDEFFSDQDMFLHFMKKSVKNSHFSPLSCHPKYYPVSRDLFHIFI